MIQKQLKVGEELFSVLYSKAKAVLGINLWGFWTLWLVFGFCKSKSRFKNSTKEGLSITSAIIQLLPISTFVRLLKRRALIWQFHHCIKFVIFFGMCISYCFSFRWKNSLENMESLWEIWSFILSEVRKFCTKALHYLCHRNTIETFYLIIIGTVLLHCFYNWLFRKKTNTWFDAP